MNLSLNVQIFLFASFSTYFDATSWPTFSSMSCEVASKSEKKFIKEAIAKLLCPKKSMILRPFASGSNAATVHLTRPNPYGLVEENGREWPQKGDFTTPLSKRVTESASEAKPNRRESNPNDEDHSREARPRRRIDLAKLQQAICPPFTKWGSYEQMSFAIASTNQYLNIKG